MSKTIRGFLSIRFAMGVAIPYLILLLLSAPVSFAQKIPAESTKATIVQRLGLDDVTITYYRPNVKGRKIWGGLVPYDKVWRTGANYPTFVTFTDTTIIEGKHKLPPNKYALYTIPQRKKWTIIFSSNLELWGAFGYDHQDDALSVDVDPDTSDFVETFTISFSDITDSKATIVIQWEKIKVPIHIEVDIDAKVLAYIKQRIKDEANEDWGLYWKGAQYLLKHNLDPELTLKWIDSSLELDQNWMNLWTKAQISAATENFENAIKYGSKALENGIEKEKYFFYQSAYDQEIDKWKKLIKKP